VRNGIETARDRVALSAQPELDALSAIVAILQELPDEASRLRVMRWSFGRFSSEFKRPLAVTPAAAVPGAAVAATPPLAAAVAPLSLGRDSLAEAVHAVAPELATPHASTAADFARQISELYDLFPSNPCGRDAVDDWLALSE